MRPTVHVLLATFNGARHLRRQWESIEAQADVDVVLHLADDGSTDGTVPLLEQMARTRAGVIAEVHWLREAPRRSATKSFLWLLRDAVSSVPGGQWFAFCDQDDVWLPDKLAVAVKALHQASDSTPALYGGRTLSVDEDERPQGLSPLFIKPPCFRNALVQSILGGNTMVMNRAAADLVSKFADADVTAHDWFSYQLISGAGGFLYYDPDAFLRYRQHRANLIGSNRGWRASWKRFKRVMRGDFRSWNDQHITALAADVSCLTADSRHVLLAFTRARHSRNPIARLRWMRRSGVFRQTTGQQLTLWVACLLGRM